MLGQPNELTPTFVAHAVHGITFFTDLARYHITANAESSSTLTPTNPAHAAHHIPYLFAPRTGLLLPRPVFDLPWHTNVIGQTRGVAWYVKVRHRRDFPTSTCVAALILPRITSPLLLARRGGGNNGDLNESKLDSGHYEDMPYCPR